jgi:hypothetical protein
MLGFYVVYNYNKELRTNLKNSLTVMAEDVVRHELYKNDPEKIKASFHLLEEYHETPFVALFDRLTFSIQDQKPVNEKVCSVVKKLPEVNDLKEAIIGLLESNHTLCKQKQDIFKEAAHEIKSPIAILKARLALFKQNDKYEKVTFVQESEDDIKTISNKLRELLFLKEIEWDMKKQKETISMQEQCSMMQQAFKPILEKKGLTMVSNWEEDFTLSVHKEAMQKVMQAVFENIFMHTKNNSTITNYVDTAHRRLYIVNEMGDKSDETLFSSFIGSKLIERLADKLDYTYDLEEREGKFYTTIVFNLSEQKCEI